MRDDFLTKLDTTASLNVAPQSIKWNRLKIHNNRNPKQDLKRNNQNIDHKMTKYNKIGQLVNYHDYMINKSLLNGLHKHNIKYIENKHYNDCYLRVIDLSDKNGTQRLSKVPPISREFITKNTNGHRIAIVDDLHKFLQHKNYKNTRCGIITLGDTDFRTRLEHQLKSKGYSIGQCRELEADNLINYMKNFNQRHNHVKIGQYAIHNDETFIHAHVELMSLTTTKKGKPSFSFSKAIHDEYPKARSNRQAFKRFRQDEDHQLVNQFSSIYSMKLVRTHQRNFVNRQQHSYSVSMTSQIANEKSTYNSYKNNNKSIASSLSSLSNSYDTTYKSKLTQLKISNAITRKSMADDLTKSTYDTATSIKRSLSSSADFEISMNYQSNSSSANKSASKTINSGINSVASVGASLSGFSLYLNTKASKIANRSSVADNKISKATSLMNMASTYFDITRDTMLDDIRDFKHSMKSYVKSSAPTRPNYIAHGFHAITSYAKGFTSQVSMKWSEHSASKQSSMLTFSKNANTPMAKSAQATYNTWFSEYDKLKSNKNDLYLEDHDKLISMNSALASGDYPLNSAQLIKSVSSIYHEPLTSYNSEFDSSVTSSNIANSIANAPSQSSVIKSLSASETVQNSLNKSINASLDRQIDARFKAKAQVSLDNQRQFKYRYNHDPEFRTKYNQNHGLHHQ